MPIMTRMRDNMPVILFGLLIAFVITIVFEWGMDYLGMSSGPTDTVGMVDGKKISYAHFTNVLKNFTDNHKSQTGTEPDESAMNLLRDQAWETIVTQFLLEDEVKKLGLQVSDQELVEWVRGDNPPEDLKRNFIDSLGMFRKDIYEQFLANPDQFIQDPEGLDKKLGTKWLVEYEKGLRQRRLQEKLQSLILASVRVNDGEVRQRYNDQNQKIDAAYVVFDPNILIRDDEVEVTESDLKSYYQENIEQYKFDASRKLKYVFFNEGASAADSLARRSEIEEAKKKAIDGADFFELIQSYTDRIDSGAFFKHGELSPAIESVVFAAKVGDVLGPIQENDGLHLTKILDERKSATEFVHASHILFSMDAASDSNAVKAKAQEIAKQAKQGANFAQLAMQYSTDASNAQRGGDLGWFAKGRMVAAFEEAAFKGKPGDVIGPVRTQFGLHIIKVHGRDAREIKIASLIIPIKPSSQTRSDVSERARDFQYIADESGFVKEAEASGFEVRETQIQEKGGVIPGIGVNEPLVRWAFANKAGSVSEPFSVQGGLAVFTVSEVINAGVRPLDEVKDAIRPLALRKKKMDKVRQLASDIRSKLPAGGDLSKVTEIDGRIGIQQTGQFAVGGFIPGIGRDLKFLGAASGLPVGQISNPIEGARGTFLIQVQSKTEFDSAGYKIQKDILSNQMLQEKRNRFLSEWLAKLKENADIEDKRDMFFR